MKNLLILLCLISSCICHGQHCERYERDYFPHFLPKNFPDQINCVDSLGRKQGAWIDYKILYNAKYRPDELDTGYYVPEYSFGYYENNRKINKWKHIYNVHMISLDKITDYYYAPDTTLATVSNQMGETLSSLYTNSDSSKWEIREANKEGSIAINCNKSGICVISYKGQMLNYFDRKDIFAAIDNPFYWHSAAIKKIDETANPLIFKQETH